MDDMLTTFEREKVVPCIIKTIKHFSSRGIFVTDSEIADNLVFDGMGLTAQRVRVLIAYIRSKNLIPRLVRNTLGYYIAESAEEIIRQIDLLRRDASMFLTEAQALSEQMPSNPILQ